ncbi:DMT family transporter [Candidatus Actinomarina]|nr:DMT family transporter [Candidatus Actinomarina sp.]MDC1071000.1 DMT family transporter [Acidimicrobiia bacterium]
MENNKSKNDTSIFKIIGGIFTAAFMWGSGNVLSRSLLIEGVGEIFLITTRVSIIGTLLLIHYSIFNKDKFNKKLLKEASTTALASIFFVGWFFIFSLQYISSGLVTLLISSAPVFTILWLKILLKDEKISKQKYISIFIGLLGVSYLFISKETGLENQGNILLGGSLAFMGVQCIALATVLNRKYAPKYKVSSWLTYQYPIVIFLSLIVFITTGTEVETLNSSQIFRVGVLAFFNLGAFTSFTWLIQRVSALQVASVDYLVPVVGVTAGVLFLDETFNSNILVAGIFIFISLIMNTKEEFST